MMAGAGTRRRAQGGGASDTVTLSGENSIAFKFNANATAYLKVDNDGNMYKKANAAAYSQIDASTDWVRPTSSAPGSYRTMYDSATGDTSYLTAWGTSGTYYALTSDREMSVYDDTSAGGGQSVTCDFHIDDGTTEQATASYTLTADREDF